MIFPLKDIYMINTTWMLDLFENFIRIFKETICFEAIVLLPIGQRRLWKSEIKVNTSKG